jgi:hypothetical protein
MMHKARHLGKVVFALVALAILGGVVMLLWNAVVPELFTGARTIDYPHAVGLLILSRILFGGFRGHGGGGGWHGGWRGRHHWARWQAMTPEEREQFHQRLRPGMHAPDRP